MKKRHLLFLLTALVLICTCIAPALGTRIFYEEQHKGFVTALELNDTAALSPHSDFYRSLYDYKAAGVTTAVLREEADGTFNTDLLLMAKLAGLDAAIAVCGGSAKSPTYEDTLRVMIEKHDIQYLLLKTAEDVAAQETPFAQLIKDFDLTLVLCENKSQLGNECPPEFNACVQSAEGRLLRCYETLKTPSAQYPSATYNPDLIYHQMYNSVRDRNTEFLLIHQLTDASDKPEENATVTQAAIQKLCTKLQSLGYKQGVMGNLKLYNPNLRLICSAGASLGILMLLYMLLALFSTLPKRAEWSMYILALAAFALTMCMPIRLILLYPTLFAPLGACFAFTLCYQASKKYKGKCTICIITALAFATLFVCSTILAAMLSGANYYLNIYTFRGVSLTLLLPVGYAGLFLLYKEYGLNPKTLSVSSLTTQLKQRLRRKHIIIAAVGIVALALYLLRSGNSGISGLEYRLRSLIGEIAIARPRTKEFLIAWPALALFVYALKHNHSRLILCIIGVCSSILFASVLNTFCHVFTDYTFSLLRTVNGLLFSIPFSAMYTGLYKHCNKPASNLDVYRKI